MELHISHIAVSAPDSLAVFLRLRLMPGVGLNRIPARGIGPAVYVRCDAPGTIRNQREAIMATTSNDQSKPQCFYYDQHINLENSSDNFRWSAAVAEFVMLLRDSEFKSHANYQQVVQLASGAIGEDKEGYRREFIDMVQSFQLVTAHK